MNIHKNSKKIQFFVRYLYNEIQVRNYKKKRSIRQKYRMLGFKGGWPEIAVSRDRENVQSTNTRPPSKIADTFYFTSRAPLRMVCWLRVFLPETLVSAPRAPSTRFTLEKKRGRSWRVVPAGNIGRSIGNGLATGNSPRIGLYFEEEQSSSENFSFFGMKFGERWQIRLWEKIECVHFSRIEKFENENEKKLK